MSFIPKREEQKQTAQAADTSWGGDDLDDIFGTPEQQGIEIGGSLAKPVPKAEWGVRKTRPGPDLLPGHFREGVAPQGNIRSGKSAGNTEAENLAEADRLAAVARFEKKATRILLKPSTIKRPPPLDFVLPCILAKTVAGLVAPGSTGKSFLGQQLAMLVGTGIDSLDIGRAPGWEFPPRLGRVLYLALEDIGAVIETRNHDITQSLVRELGPEAAAARLDEVGDRLDESVDMRSLIGTEADLLDDMDTKEWLKEIASGYRLIIIDTLRLAAPNAEENDSRDMGRLLSFLNAVAARGPAVLYVHHAGKNAVIEGRTDAQSARGSGAISDHARSMFGMRTLRKDEAADGAYADGKRVDPDEHWKFVSLNVSKTNNAAPFADLWFRKGEHGVLRYVTMSAAGPAGSQKTQRPGNEIETRGVKNVGF